MGGIVILKQSLINFLGTAGYTFLMEFIMAIITVIVYYVVYKMVKKLVKKGFEKTSDNKKIKYVDQRRMNTMKEIMLSIIKYFFYFLVFSKVVTLFGGKDAITSIIAVAGVGGVAIAFGAQSLVKDIITGCFLLLEDQLSINDIVTVCGITGTVEEFGLRTTKIRSANGDLHTIPNGQITTVTNMTRDFKCAVVDVGICYEDNLEYVMGVIKDEMEKLFKTAEGLQEVPNVLGVVSFDDSAVVLRINAKCDIKKNAAIEREIRKCVKIRFDNEGISMPYPHRTIDISNMTNIEK